MHYWWLLTKTMSSSSKPERISALCYGYLNVSLPVIYKMFNGRNHIIILKFFNLFFEIIWNIRRIRRIGQRISVSPLLLTFPHFCLFLPSPFDAHLSYMNQHIICWLPQDNYKIEEINSNTLWPSILLMFSDILHCNFFPCLGSCIDFRGRISV